jgi:predicted transposase/invertase (TIGR01784 family)
VSRKNDSSGEDMLGKFLDPKNDFAFKSIFGTQKHKKVLIHFINDMVGLSGEKAIKTVHFLKTTQDPDIASKKQSLIDVLCTDSLGRQYIIEMQVARTAGFEKRAQYYAARAYGQQLQQGDEYRTLKEIIFIAITDFVMFPDKPQFYSTHCLLDKETFEHDLKDFSFSFLELPKFDKTIDELSNMVEKWAYFFKHAYHTRDEELVKLIGNDTILREAYHALDRFNWTQVQLNTYQQQEKRERDAMSILIQAREEGREEGREEERTHLVNKLRKKGMSDAAIAELLEFAENPL